MSLLGGILVGAASLAGSAVNSLFNKKSVSDANKSNRQLAEYQSNWQQAENERAYGRQLEMWNLENTYNSPTAQMARLKDAGLNPNLVYGSGAVGNSSGSTPRYEAANYQRPQMQAYQGYNLGLEMLPQKLCKCKRYRLKLNKLSNKQSMIKLRWPAVL